MSSRLSGSRLNIDVRFESDLRPGPVGELIHVIDYDGTHDVWYRPVDLNDPAILARPGGLRPLEADPRTHQQVVYAVAMSVLERFERFLGRRFRWRKESALVIVPHAFEGRNAFFDPTRRAVLCGYYRADSREPGANLPGQVMFTCLSVDIVAHEVTHAVMHRIRPYFSVATNKDVFAWHEAFADLVALFHHFAFPEVVSAAVASSRGDLHEGHGLLDLAAEFGRSTGRGTALRSAIQDRKATPETFTNAFEPHERGACFVAGVFDAYLQSYKASIADLLRIATGGTGVLPAGHLHPDLVDRVTKEAVKHADRFLGMVVRAFDLLPVVDVTFGDVVRAIVTADRSLYPNDEKNLRATLVEALRQRGIYPSSISSLADESLVLPAPYVELNLYEPGSSLDMSGVIHSATRDLDPAGDPGEVRSNEADDESAPRLGNATRTVARELVRWARTHALELGLDPSVAVALGGLHVAYRQAADRQPRPEIVLQFHQRRKDLEDQTLSEHLRVPLRAGTTVIARVDGTVERLITKPLPLSDPAVLGDLAGEIGVAARAYHEVGVRRLDSIREWTADCEERDALTAWTATPALNRLSFAQLHLYSDEEDGT
ncbi:MAG TPA: hypothetical protein VF714_04245 [Jatrophihabitans sp.]